MTERNRPEHTFHMQIDRKQVTTMSERLTGADLRQLAQPPVGPERDLYQIRPGDEDLLIADGDAVDIRDGLRFFTAPGQINPGAGP